MSASAMALAEIDAPDARVVGDLGGGPLAQHLALDENGDALGEAEDEVHVVLDDQNGDARGQLLETLEDAMGFERGHAGRWLVEQQHGGPEAQGDGDLHKPLLAVREIQDAAAGIGGQVERREELERFRTDARVSARWPPQASADPVTLGDPERDVVEHAHVAEQRVDLEGAAEAAPDARGLRQARHVLAAEEDLAGGGHETPSDHVDERGLAGAVGSDERVTDARLEPQVHAIGHGLRAEVLAEGAGLERDRHATTRRRPRAASASAIPRRPPRAKRTTRTRMKPMPRYQYCGNCLASTSCATR